MEPLKLVSPESATGNVAENLSVVKRKFGFIPNLYASFANNPAFLEGYMRLSAEFEKSKNLSPIEKEVVLLTASVENHCQYCAAGYTAVLRKMKADDDIAISIRGKRALKDDKLDALVDLTREIVVQRGNPSENSMKLFLEAGFSTLAITDILMGVALKAMATYYFHIFPVTIDKEYQAEVDFLSIDEAMI